MTSKHRSLLLLILCAGLTCGAPEVSAQTGGDKVLAAGVGGDGAADTVADVSALAGKWVWGSIGGTVWSHTGSYADGNGSRFTYQFSPGGVVEYTGIINATMGNCSRMVLQSKKGRARLSGDTLTIKWARGISRQDLFCERASDSTKTTPAETETLKVAFKTSSTGQRQLCTVSKSGEACFTRAE
jgi:hypothetical protein